MSGHTRLTLIYCCLKLVDSRSEDGASLGVILILIGALWEEHRGGVRLLGLHPKEHGGAVAFLVWAWKLGEGFGTGQTHQQSTQVWFSARPGPEKMR